MAFIYFCLKLPKVTYFTELIPPNVLDIPGCPMSFSKFSLACLTAVGMVFLSNGTFYKSTSESHWDQKFSYIIIVMVLLLHQILLLQRVRYFTLSGANAVAQFLDH